MPHRTPRSYDEITRKTVIEPDSSWRPTPEQVHQAHEGFRHLDDDEKTLADRIDTALGESCFDCENVMVEVERDIVTLRGSVRDPASLTHIHDIVANVDGVRSVIDRLVVAAH